MIKQVAGIVLFAIILTSGASSALSDEQLSTLPPPQVVKLADRVVLVSSDWKIQRDPNVKPDDVAVETLKDEFKIRHHVALAEDPASAASKIRLTVMPGTVVVDSAVDRDRDLLAGEAYQIDISNSEIRVMGNSPAGLFYGVETLVQLARDSANGVTLPIGRIVDWPDMQFRAIYWDDAHHLERPDALKHAIRQAAFFKINAFVIKLEGHFQYHGVPAIVEPYALSPAELQELTDYAARYYVQLVPYLDAPAHIAFILKHPEYAGLRAFPDCNYELNMTNPDSLKLLSGMFQDLLDANKGVKYFYLSTDEPYYAGMCPDEAARKKDVGSPGKLLADFLQKAAGYLHDRGRTVVIWGEYPMKPGDVPALPTYLVNGETDNGDFDVACNARGIRQLVYTSIEGEEKLFPNYAFASPSAQLHKRENGKARVTEAIDSIHAAVASKRADLIGVTVAGWGDMGLHPETFWLGYATVAASAWNQAGNDPARAPADFYRAFYGPSSSGMDRIYTLMATQAQLWSESWDLAGSTQRKGIWGNSNSIFHPRHSAGDQTIVLPPAPNPTDLSVHSKWRSENTRRLELAGSYLADNDELLALLRQNIDHVELNRYNLEVFLSIAQICRQNLQMLAAMSDMDASIEAAGKAAAAGQPAVAIASLDQAIKIAIDIRRQRNEVLKNAAQTWNKSWYPRVAQANGRVFLHELDDVKDHLPDRTVGMEYLVYRELILPMDKWMADVLTARNAYATAHELPTKAVEFKWDDTN